MTLTGGGCSSAATATAIVSNVIATVPIISPGSGYNRHRPSPSRTAAAAAEPTAAAIMAGVELHQTSLGILRRDNWLKVRLWHAELGR